MNRRQLGLGAAAAAFASASGAAVAQTRDPAAVAFYDSFNDQLARLPATIQPDVRAFYEMNGWRPVWTPERLRSLQAAAGRAERHGLSQSDFFDFPALASVPASAEMRTTAAAPRPSCRRFITDALRPFHAGPAPTPRWSNAGMLSAFRPNRKAPVRRPTPS